MSTYLPHLVFEADSLSVPWGKNRVQTFAEDTDAVELLLWRYRVYF